MSEDTTSMNNEQNEKKRKNAGENPYLVAADKLGKLAEFEEKVDEYLEGNRTPEEYKQLCDWEVKAFNDGWREKNGSLPKPGDIESLLPDSVVTPDAHIAIPKLREREVEVAMVSSGFNHLVQPNARILDIPEDLALANDLIYEPNEGLREVKVNVSGNKVSALDKVTGVMANKGIKPEETAYVDDNNWGQKGMEHKLEEGGHVFYLGDDSTKDEPLPPDAAIRQSDRFYPIDSLRDIPKHPAVVSGKIKGVIFDADGTVIDTQ